MEEDPKLTGENTSKRDEAGRFLPGYTANPLGRPKGQSIKDRVRKWLEEHPQDMDDFIEHFIKNNRELAWQMLEGRPTQALAGDKENPITLNVIAYGNNHTLPIPTEGIPTELPECSSEIQDSSLPPSSGQE